MTYFSETPYFNFTIAIIMTVVASLAVIGLGYALVALYDDLKLWWRNKRRKS